MLGPVELSVHGSPVALPPLERALVAILAAHHGRIVTVERLTDGLWGTHPPGGARNRIQALVASLRRLAGRDLVTTRPPGYLLGGPVTVDSADFAGEVRAAEAFGDAEPAVDVLDRALGRWRDDAFVDVSSPLVGFERGRLHELREHAREERFEAQLSLGRHRELIPELVRAVDDRPLRQRLRGQLMVALQRSGREAEALAAYRAGARLLADEHGLDPSHDLRRLHERILAGEYPGRELRPPRERAPARGWAPAAVRPDQLPAVTADFVGRDKELGQLRSLLSHTPDVAGAGQVVVVTGLPGAGKTTLALRAAHEHRQEFPDGCLFADLGDDADPSAVLASFLRALGVPGDAVPSDVRERAALYRSALAGRRVLVVLDGVAGAGQVRPLLPPGSSTTLVTAAASLGGLPGVTVLPLDVLPLADGLDLLAGLAGADRVGREADEAAEVVELCGSLPLALRIAGVRLAERDTTVADLRDRLRGEHRRLDELSAGGLDVRGSLTAGFDRLRPAAARLLGLLSRLSPGSFRVHDPDLLDELCGARMLTPQGDGRVRMHDLVRLYARERVPVAGDDLVAWYEDLLRRAVRAGASIPSGFLPRTPMGGSTRDGAVTWFEEEWDGLLAAAADLLALGRPGLAGRMVDAMGPFALARRGHLPRWAASVEAVLAEPEGLAVPTAVSLRLGLAAALRLTGRVAEALPLLRAVYRDGRGRLPEHQIAAAAAYARCGPRRAEPALRIALSLCAVHRPAGPVAAACLIAAGRHYGTSAFGRWALAAAAELGAADPQ